MKRIRKGDEIVVIAGKDKGRRGQVLKVVSDEKLLIEGVNRVRKHQKPNPVAGVQGGIIDKEMPIHVSNVMLWNPNKESGDRVGFKILEDNRKVRYFKSDGETVDL